MFIARDLGEMGSDFHIIANQLLWSNWLQYIQQQHNEIGWLLLLVVDDRQQGESGGGGGQGEEEVVSLKGPNWKGLREIVRRCKADARRKESDIRENLLCRGLSCRVTSFVAPAFMEKRAAEASAQPPIKSPRQAFHFSK